MEFHLYPCGHRSRALAQGSCGRKNSLRNRRISSSSSSSSPPPGSAAGTMSKSMAMCSRSQGRRDSAELMRGGGLGLGEDVKGDGKEGGIHGRQGVSHGGIEEKTLFHCKMIGCAPLPTYECGHLHHIAQYSTKLALYPFLPPFPFLLVEEEFSS